jgi:hypothetical protein
MKYLDRPKASSRSAVAMEITTDTLISGKAFGYLTDAYIVGGRDGELEKALLEAWQREKPNTGTRRFLATAYLDVRRRQYLWSHQEFGKSLGLAKKSGRPLGENDIWRAFRPEDREAIDAQIAKQGDEQFERVRQDYNKLLEALRAGTLRNG